ncbi:MAG: sulfatase-like hydrolase/transferase [Actinomycetota bacterium]
MGRLTNRWARAASCLLFVVALSGTWTRHEASAATPPNIVLILTDDQRWDSLWAMPTVQSDLVDHGVDFTNAFVTNSSCCPSRASILTGEYSHSTGVYSSAEDGPQAGFASFRDSSTIATWLQGAGYRTALIGKYLNGYTPDHISYVPPGWNRWVAFATKGEGGAAYYDYDLSVGGAGKAGTAVSYGSDASDYSTDVLSKYATSFIRQTDPSKPLFLDFTPKAPHGPYTPAPRDAEAFPDLAPNRPPSYNESDVSDKPAYIRDLQPFAGAEQTTLDAQYQDAYRSLLAVDRAVGSIVTALSDTGRLDNTLIVFASDNGLLWGEHRYHGKQLAYDESIRVPLVIRDDNLGLADGSMDPHVVANIDFAPTFADVAGSAAPGAEGGSLLPLLTQSNPQWRSDLLVEHEQRVFKDSYPTFCAVRSPDLAYTAYGTGEEELYDVNADPYELQNLAYDPGHASELQAMRDALTGLCSPPPPGGYQPPAAPVVAITSGPHNPSSSPGATFAFSAQENRAAFHCSMDGAPFTRCTSPMSYPSLSKGLHSFAVHATVNGGSHGNTAQWVWRSQGTGATVDVSDGGLSPAIAYATRGSRVSWSFDGPSDDSVTDTSGLALFDSGARPAGGSYSFVPPGAGNYAYADGQDPSVTGSIRVPIAVSPETGTTSTRYRVTWAADPPSGAHAFQVQVRPPGATKFSDWLPASGSDFAVFDSSSASWSGRGVYAFRARYVRTPSGAATGYSGVRVMDVT